VGIDGKESLVEHQINADGKIKLRFNKVFLKNRQAVYKKMPVVVFSPDDLRLTKSSPRHRRDFLDDILCKISEGFYDTCLKYQKILLQRNSLLKGLGINQNNNSRKETLDVWNEKLACTGTKIITERLRLLETIKLNFIKYMSYFFKGSFFEIDYVFSWAEKDGNTFTSGSNLADVFLNNLALKTKKDIMTKSTSVGPHRDDFIITLNKKEIRYFGSQGQQRTASVCLKLAELDVLKDVIEKKPVLLLDDVLSELDIERKTLLLKLIKQNFQTFITAANYEAIKDIKLDDYQKYNVTNNEVIQL
jgi:DNA replication and repair protein RecF